MYVHVCTKFEFAVLIMIDTHPCYNCLWAYICVYPIFVWETVDPEDDVIYHLDDQSVWVLENRKIMEEREEKSRCSVNKDANPNIARKEPK